MAFTSGLRCALRSCSNRLSSTADSWVVARVWCRLGQRQQRRWGQQAAGSGGGGGRRRQPVARTRRCERVDGSIVEGNDRHAVFDSQPGRHGLRLKCRFRGGRASKRHKHRTAVGINCETARNARDLAPWRPTPLARSAKCHGPFGSSWACRTLHGGFEGAAFFVTCKSHSCACRIQRPSSGSDVNGDESGGGAGVRPSRLGKQEPDECTTQPVIVWLRAVD